MSRRFDHYPERDIYLGEIARDVKAGLSDKDLMRKYRISPLGLAGTLRSLSAAGLLSRRDLLNRGVKKRTIFINEIVADIRAGMSDAELRDKYGVSQRKLRRVFGRLLDERALALEELAARQGTSLGRSRRDLRRRPRNLPVFELPIYELGKPDARLSVEDITESGLRVTGADTRVDEVTTFTMLPTDMCSAEPLAFEARCRWVRTDNNGRLTAGFEIPHIDGRNLEQLRRVIEEVTVRFEN